MACFLATLLSVRPVLCLNACHLQNGARHLPVNMIFLEMNIWLNKLTTSGGKPFYFAEGNKKRVSENSIFHDLQSSNSKIASTKSWNNKHKPL